MANDGGRKGRGVPQGWRNFAVVAENGQLWARRGGRAADGTDAENPHGGREGGSSRRGGEGGTEDARGEDAPRRPRAARRSVRGG